MNRWIRRLSLACLMAVCGPGQAAPADWVFLGAEIVGGPRPGLTALAVAGERIVAVGTDRQIQPLIGRHTRVIHARGRSLIPGLIDGHMHAIRAGLTDAHEVKWSGISKLSEAMELLRQRAHTGDEHDWVIVAGGWTPEQFAEKRGPTLAELEQAVGQRPAYVQRAYAAVLITPEGMRRLPWEQNASLASKLSAEIDSQGRETGWLAADARTISSVYDLLPTPGAAQQARGTAQWYRQLTGWGLTGVLDPGGYNLPPQALQVTQALWQIGQLPLRVRFSLSAPKAHQELDDFARLTALVPMGWGDDWLRFNGLGENVTWGMYNNARPSDDDKAELARVLQWAAQRKMTVTFHWNDDETVTHLLDVIEAVNRQNDVSALRWSIAHLNNATLPSLQRMRRLGMGWLVQNAAYFQRGLMLVKWGEAALHRTPPLGDAIRMGLPIGLGTDAHRVMDPDPFVCLQWAVDGLSVDGRRTRGPEHLLGREQALWAYTQGVAWFSHEEHQRGRLAVGQWADLALLNDSYLRIETSRIHTLRAELTLVGGKQVYPSSDSNNLQQEKKP
jgi:predicted amidohydrolase YtcJ